ncbi:MAG: 3-isopropylmalate dehydratase small subunit [Gammaproteobacteria bacterium]|nr:3-isopropylmalate dehydratase small subunit [Gammaproteobacteria bacterium]
MEPLTRLRGIAAPLPIDNVDTDAIVPSRETQSVSRTGYAEKLFANWRYKAGTRIVNPDFVLNNKPFDQAVFLVAGANFGCGSSREAAVWSLKQFGIRCVLAESYGAIFHNNCIRNSLLPVALAKREVAEILAHIEANPEAPVVSLDLVERMVSAGASRFGFDIDERDRNMLLNGDDEVELTLRKAAAIEDHIERDRARRPWLYQARN